MELLNKSLKTKIQLIIGNVMDDLGEVKGSRVELKVPYGYV